MSPMKKSRSSAADGFLAEAGDDEDDVKEEHDEDDEHKPDGDDIECPKGRLGTVVQKMGSKLPRILATINSLQWRIPLKESSVRPILRTTAGPKVALESSEHLLMVARNAEHTNIVTKLLELTLGLVSVDKDDSARNLAKVSSPLGALAEILRSRRPEARFGAEVMLLKVLVRAGGGGVSRAHLRRGTVGFAGIHGPWCHPLVWPRTTDAPLVSSNSAPDKAVSLPDRACPDSTLADPAPLWHSFAEGVI